ncbi:BglG family transcription antiterminator [Pectinatus brassicae]|uniref:Lichenan operon transcriptional antiterminator n=1 Tax=Pectinatus brassicae TaxID=862415 RepID=A0A840UF01_9FIRM|nr:PRD domain-containing protein [Pectinatus brassicae]MBB5336301.1 lichenan operon transcriptional antiterminator [Pectinatus brassicae]
MNSKHFDLIYLLINTNILLTAAAIADKLSVSTRTVMSYISDINFFHPQLITSSYKGYRIDKTRGRALIARNNLSPQTANERINWLLKNSLLSADSDNQINIVTAAEKLCVSTETLHKDLILLKRKIKKYKIKARINADYIYLTGLETDIRNLLNFVLCETLSKDKVCTSSLQQIFPKAPIDELYDLLLQQSSKQNYFINDCLIFNLILEILITMERIQHNHIISKSLVQLSTSPISQAIFDYIQKFYNIKVVSIEEKYIQELLLGYLLPADFNHLSITALKKRMPKKSEKFFNDLFQKIRCLLPFIDLNERFMIRFALNLHNLLCRLSTGHISYDPRKNDMKIASPFAFKCTAAIANEIQKITAVIINEDSCAYLALHIGLNLASKHKFDFEKISCALLITPYFDYDKELKENLQRNFSNDISVRQILCCEKELSQLKKVDLIITTVPLPIGFNTDWVVTDALLSTKTIQNIKQHIITKKAQKKRSIIQNFFNNFGNETLFKHIPAQCSLESIKQQTQNLLENNEYIAACSKCSTEYKIHFNTFGHIAVADIIFHNVKKTGLVTIVNKKPRIINNNPIDIIFIITLHPDDWEIMQYSLDLIINTLQEIDILHKIIKAVNYKEFSKCICETICF